MKRIGPPSEGDEQFTRLETEWPECRLLCAASRTFILKVALEKNFGMFVDSLPYFDMPLSILPKTALRKAEEKGYLGICYPCSHYFFADRSRMARSNVPAQYSLLYRASANLQTSTSRVGTDVLSNIRIVFEAEQPLPEDSLCYVSLLLSGAESRYIAMTRSMDGMQASVDLDWIIPVGCMRYQQFYVFVTVIAPSEANHPRLWGTVHMESKAMALQKALVQTASKLGVTVRWTSGNLLSWDIASTLGEKAEIYYIGEGVCAPRYLK